MTDALKIGVIGIGRDELVGILDATPGVEPVATSDIDAATRVQSGELSYVIGVCESGGNNTLQDKMTFDPTNGMCMNPMT